MLLAGLPHLRRLGLPHPSATAVLAVLPVSRSQGYALKGRLEASLENLVQPPGRPSKPPPEPAPPALATEVLRYVADHPGAISGGVGRRRYSDGFRLFILELLEGHRDVPLDAFAEATTIPLGSLKDWLRGGAACVDVERLAPATAPAPRDAQLKTLLAEWERWDGTFVGFCDHVQLHCRLPFGRTLIATLLEGLGVRLRQRRPGRGSDEEALRAAFQTFFPHAQWVGDGSWVPVEIDGELFVFNVELDIDAHSGAFVGADVSPVENSAAVIAAVRDAVASTGVRPLALLLDNKPCNHTDEVVDELGDTLLIRGTPYRAQGRGHVEGAFSLLKPTLAGLGLQAGGSRLDLGASYLANLVIAACRAINHRPRRDRQGRSRVQLLDEAPTPEQVEQAKRDLEALKRRQEQARRTRAARHNPVVRARLDAAYARLGLDDPQGHILNATARYPLDAVVEGIAIFEARQRLGSLPDTADARYLLGVVRNLAREHESWALAEALWEERVATADAIARRLQQQYDAGLNRLMHPSKQVLEYVDRALGTRSRLERFFWLTAAADVAHGQLPEHRPLLFRLAARRISATHAVPLTERTQAIRFLACKVRPLR